MKKLPRPDVQVRKDHSGPDIRTVVRLEWEFFSLEMYEDEALILARTIYDVLEEAP